MRLYPFVFTGKERDEETGYGYFGARYMDHELTTMWLSVDPMADKYPNISPYAYCMWNSLLLADPNGKVPVFYGLLQYQGRAKYGNDCVGETLTVGNFQVTPFYDNNNNLLGYNAGRFHEDGNYVTEYQMEPDDIEMFSRNVKTYEAAVNLLYCNGEPDWGAASLGQHMSTGDLKGMVADLWNMWTDAFKDPEFCFSLALSIAGTGVMLPRGTRLPVSKTVRSLQRKIQEHQQKLGDYLSNPASMDNKGILKGASYKKFKSVFYGRVKHLEKEIENFKKNIVNHN